MQSLHLSSYTAVTCLGPGLSPTLDALRAGRSGLSPCAFETVTLDTYVGEVAGVDDLELRLDLAAFDCRNNRLAELALEQDGLAEAVARAARRFGKDRVGVFLGTSTSGILETELAYRRRDPESGALPPGFRYEQTHKTYSVADFVRRYCALALREGFLPGGIGTRTPDPAIGIRYLVERLDQAPRRVLSNSFGFGGSNCSLILGRAD